MNANGAQEILGKIVEQIFGRKNPLTLDQFIAKFAFDVEIPNRVIDVTTGKPTWTQSNNPTKFKTMDEAYSKEAEKDELKPKRPLNGLKDVLAAWEEVNFILTERKFDSENVAESDNIIASENVYRSQCVVRSKNVVFSDDLIDCEYVAASQRSYMSTYSIRLEDSFKCANSFNISWSEDVSNSFFLQACKSVHDSMFCSSLTGRRFCIANMQFEEAEYNKFKQEVFSWILKS